eukprot:5682131-Pyramimonas_sp.AAC.1
MRARRATRMRGAVGDERGSAEAPQIWPFTGPIGATREIGGRGRSDEEYAEGGGSHCRATFPRAATGSDRAERRRAS